MKKKLLQVNTMKPLTAASVSAVSLSDIPTAHIYGESRTRSQIFQLLLREGPLTAVALGMRLELAPVGVRRHLDHMLQAGFAQVSQVKKASSDSEHMRGRPAKSYELTALGRKQLGHTYSDLAIEALSEIKELAGEKALRSFATARADRMIIQAGNSLPADASKIERAMVLADVLTAQGYAATVRKVHAGVEVCQHHCPLSEVAEHYPEFCQGEHQVFSEYFDQPVQRLATIAAGHRACTTFIPLSDMTDSRSKTETAKS